MANISAGVYTKIIDLSTYINAVPSTTGFIAGLAKKGRDNELVFMGSRSEFIGEFGEPNMDYGKNYSQGLYCGYNYLGESGSLYFLRPMPDSASYANIMISSKMQAGDTNAVISLVYIDTTAANSKAEILTAIEADGTNSPVCILRPIGRGEYYNGISVKISEHSNPIFEGLFVLDIYERQSDGVDEIIESFDISFDPNAVDDVGETLFIEDVLNDYSNVLRAEMTLTSGAYTTGYELAVKIFDKEIGDVTATGWDDGTGVATATITDDKQDFSQWAGSGTADYAIIAIDDKGNKLNGWFGAASGTDNETIAVFQERDLTTQNWNYDATSDLADFNWTGDITYIVKKSLADIGGAFTASVPLKKGSDGDLLNADGSINTTTAKQILSNAYAGTIDDEVLNTEDIYFNMIFDCGYHADVKDWISTLATTRKDCIAIMDNGDNASVAASLLARKNDNTFNNYYVALHEPYNKVYDIFTGKDIWVSPVYHMSYLLPRNDSVGEQWFAVAGFERGVIDTIKEMRFSPKLGERDNFYKKQINPIVKFAPGHTVWSQLTSQAKPSALQDVNIVRLLLYVKKALEDFSKFFIFEQNDELTWSQVSAEIIAFLEDIKSRRGLYDYQVEVGATDYEKKRKTFHANVTLNPTRVVEKIELNFFVK